MLVTRRSFLVGFLASALAPLRMALASVRTIHGTIYPHVPINSGGLNTCVTVGGSGNNGTIVTGTANLAANVGWFYGGVTSAGTITFQYFLDGKPISPQLQQFTTGGPPAFPYSWDSTKFLDGSAVPDGSHVLHGLFLDHTTDVAYTMRTFGCTCLVYNHRAVPTDPPSQVVSTTAGQNGMVRMFPPSWPDFVTYPGPSDRNPSNAAQMWPYNFNPPVPLNSNRNPSPQLVMEMLTGSRVYEYSTNPWWASTLSGGVYILQMNVENGDPGSTSQGPYLAQLGDCYADGGRNDNEVSWASTFVESPRGSAWYGIELSGRLIRIDHYGKVTTIAGYTKDRTKLKYDTQQRNVAGPYDEVAFLSRMTFVGNNSAGDHDLGTGTDLAFDPLDPTHKTIFVVKNEDSCIVKVDMSTSPATITLFAGQDGVPGYADGPLTSAQFDNPTSLAIAADGTMYIADTNNCVIRKIAPARKTVTTFLGNQAARPTPTQVQTSQVGEIQGTPVISAYSPNTIIAFTDPRFCLPYPFTIRLNSTGDIIVWESSLLHIRRLWLSGTHVGHATSIGYWGQRTTNVPYFVSNIPNAWGWIDVDTAGVFGRIDDIFASQVLSGDGAAETYFRISIDGVNYFEDGGGEPIGHCSGSPVSVDGGWAHYPWAIAISKFESRFLATGVANNGVCCVRARQTGDVYPDFPDLDSSFLNSRAFLSGQYIFATGTVSGRGANANGFPNSYSGAPVTNVFPFNIRPSFWAIRGNAGSGHLGIFNWGGHDTNSFDALNSAFPSKKPGDAGDQALAAYIQQGFGGSVPRPEITGNDMRDLIYFIRYNTTAGSIGSGSPQKFPVQPGADHPDTGNYPTILTLSAVRNSRTSITVHWTTDKPTIGFAGCGSPTQQGTVAPYPVFSPIEEFTVPYQGNAGGGLTHSATINQCPANVSPLHYTVCVKDMAGNSSYASDKTIA